ncbi:parallel beta-helix repeat protein [Mesorhizobium soli]|uniref:right-handed parallel beta-helix repeat-containing protein n=1 Tax=Pseudaminobacter soli (ex Li et al. 2025) TaxID=1295366 RepID=UPI002475B183|nr:right-handed parallel beta-helix repeat-containing protein [Mesorhizobium soli]MDH6233270.1 parallel beta-helix repeat protein [Mesorhizobium soli]
MRSAWAVSATVLGICTVSSAHADDIFAKRWGAWFEGGAQVSKNRSLGQADLFAPLYQNSDTLLFADLRGMFDDRDAVEGNFGLGLRQMLPSGWNLGAYGYYDVRRSSLDNTFHQNTLGVEALSEYLDFRANAYLPLGNHEKRMRAGSWSSVTSTGPEAVLMGTSLGIQTQTITTLGTSFLIERAMAGFDAEVGVRLPVFPDDLKLDLRAFGGGYHFQAAGMESISGPRARLELMARDFAGLPGVKLTGDLTWQNDMVRGDQLIAAVRLRVPFNASVTRDRPLTYMEERMLDRVVRDVDVVSNTGNETTSKSVTVTTTEDAINTWNGETVTSLVQVDATTQDHAALQAALDSVGADGIVLLNGNIGAPGGITLNDKQTLLGGGTVLKLKGATSGAEVDFTAPGASGGISGAAGTAVTMATDSSLRGLSVENISSNANSFAVVGASGAGLHDVTIVSAANGVKVNNITNFTLQGGSITAAQGSAVNIAGSTGLSISGATIVQNGASGMGIVADNASGTIYGNTITTNGNGNGFDDTDPDARPSHGLSVSNSGGLTIANNTITTNGTQANGIHVTNSAGIQISGNTVTTNNYMSRGIHLLDSNGATISGNTIVTNTQNDSNWSSLTIAFGIITERSSNLTIRDNTISTSMRGGHGVYMRYGANNTISGNTVTTSGEAASAISMVRSTSNTVSGNILTTTGPGSSIGVLFGLLSDNGVAENNTVTTWSAPGVVVNYASGVTVRNNRLARGDDGVFTTEDDTVITGNTP